MDQWFRSGRGDASQKPEALLESQAQRLKEENMRLLREQNLKLLKEVEKLRSQNRGMGEVAQQFGQLSGSDRD